MLEIESSPQLVVHVVSHTHWDREWYQPSGRFRQQLVAVMDELLDDPPREGNSFLLDGQAVMLDDYLAVRPERRPLLETRLAHGALDAGPWYVLGDELIPGGESLVRNLLAGRRVLAALGASVPPVMYSPDAFGHPAALPALAAGFGMAVIVLWRGYGGPAWPPGDTVQWTAADGSRVLLYHLAPDGYGLGASLPTDDRAAAARWASLLAVLAPRAILGLTLLPNGADHHARQRDLEPALAALQRIAAPAVVRAGSLRAFAADLAARAARVSLPVVQGELRASAGYTWPLQGTVATRARQKRRHAMVERALVRDAEPWTALAARVGTRSRRALVQAAWKTLLLCQPHDTLCGCSIDQVARAMDARLEDADSQAAGLRDDALGEIIGHNSARARTQRDEWQPVVVARNRAARPRGGVAEVEVLRPIAPVRVGPGSGGEATVHALPPAFALDHGRAHVQVLDRVLRHDRVESPLHYPEDAWVEAVHAVAWVPAAGGYGTLSLPIGDGDNGEVPAARVRGSGAELENEWLRVRVDAQGTVHVVCLATGVECPSLLALEDVGDGGDLYTHSPRPPVLLSSTLGEARVVHTGPLRATIDGTMRLDVPLALDGDGRSSATRALEMRVTLTLDAASPFLRIAVCGENICRDHRLRLVIRTGLSGARIYADAAFGPVRRAAIVAPPSAAEFAPPTAPLARYVTLATDTHGFTVYSDGLAEYESAEGGPGDIAITLVRAVGELSRNTLPERPGHAGWPAPTPEAQTPGTFEGSFAILPHGVRDAATIDFIERTADDVLLPLVGHTVRSALGVSLPTFGIELEGQGLVFSACKESEHDDWTVLRCVNVTDRDVAGVWRCGFAVREAHRARLDETVGERTEVAGDGVAFVARGGEIVTMMVKGAR